MIHNQRTHEMQWYLVSLSLLIICMTNIDDTGMPVVNLSNKIKQNGVRIQAHYKASCRFSLQTDLLQLILL